MKNFPVSIYKKSSREMINSTGDKHTAVFKTRYGTILPLPYIKKRNK